LPTGTTLYKDNWAIVDLKTKKDDEDFLEWKRGKLYLARTDSTRTAIPCPKQ